MDLPIDTSKLTFVVSEPCAPRVDFQTGEQRVDKQSQRPIFDVVVLAGDGKTSGPIKIKMFTDIKAAQMTPVMVSGLVLTRMTMRDGAQIEYYTAESITPAVGGDGWGPAPATPAAGKSAGATGKGDA